MIQYQIEKIRMFVTAMRTTSTISDSTAFDDNLDNESNKADMFMNSPSVRRPLVMMMALNRWRLRVRSHKSRTAMSRIRRNASQPPERGLSSIPGM